MNVKDLFADDEFEFLKVSEREIACERLLFNTTEDILLAMQDSGMKQSDLAKKLGKSKAHVSKLLDGTRNMTLKTLSDISYALKTEVKVVIYKNGKDVSHQILDDTHRYTSTSNDITIPERSVIRVSFTPAVDKMDYIDNATY